MSLTLPTAADAGVTPIEFEDYYESTLAQPLGTSDTDIYPETMPQSECSFVVIDPAGSSPEICFFNEVGANYLRCPSATDGQGRGVFQTTPDDWDSGTTIGIYSMAAFFEGIVTGKFMRDGFIEARHFSADIDPNSWVGVGVSLTYGSHVGQREVTYVGSGDLTSYLSEGQKLQLPRATNVGYQSCLLTASSSQYASKSSPSGLSFTDDFTVEAHIYVNSYSNPGTIIGRHATNTGWGLRLNSDGTLELFGRLSSGNNRARKTTVMVPKGRWVHVAATLDMSGNTGAVYFDGIDVPSTTNNNGTATSLTQGTDDLIIGKDNSTNYFDGYVSDVRVWSAVRTQTNVKDNMLKRLVGNETNLVAYFKLSGDFNDSTSNANNLTAAGSAVATNTDKTPFHATEYGFITKIAYATGSTTITVFTGQNLAPAENLSSVSYSGAAAPYGFPLGDHNWSVITRSGTSRTTNSTSLASLTEKITVPTGSWNVWAKGELSINISTNPASRRYGYFMLTSTGAQEYDDLFASVVLKTGASAEQETGYIFNVWQPIQLTAAKTLTAYGSISTTGPQPDLYLGRNGPYTTFRAVIAYPH